MKSVAYKYVFDKHVVHYHKYLLAFERRSSLFRDNFKDIERIEITMWR